METGSPKSQLQSAHDGTSSHGSGAAEVVDTFFVPYRIPGKTSKRDVKLIDTARRAHVARSSRRKSASTAAARQSAKLVRKTRDTPETRDDPVGQPSRDANVDGHTKSTKSKTVPSPVSRLQSLEPFSAFPFTVDASAASAIQYFQNVWARTAFQSATAGQSQQRVNEGETSLVVNQVMSNELNAHAFQAAVIMRMATVHNAKDVAQNHAAFALSKLRSLIERGQLNGDECLLPVLFLAGYETYCGNLYGTRIHLQALRVLNAEKRLSGYLGKLCRNMDLFSAWCTILPPIFPAPRVDFKMTTDTEQSTVAGQGFAAYADVLGHELCEIIVDVVNCAHSAQHTTTTTEEGVKLIAWSENLTHRVLEQQQQLPRTCIKESCIIALMMWLSYLPATVMKEDPHVTSQQDFVKLMPGRGTALVDRLKQCELTTALELWILAVGIVCGVDQDDVEYCAVKFAKLGRDLKVTDVSQCLRSFLWLDNLDLIDESVLTQLLDDVNDQQVSKEAIRKAVDWAAETRVKKVDSAEEKRQCVRVTRRPSNVFRLGA